MIQIDKTKLTLNFHLPKEFKVYLKNWQSQSHFSAKRQKMQNIDEILPVILHSAILKRPPFFCFLRQRPAFWCVTLFLIALRVCKRIWAKTFFFLEIIGGHICPPLPPAWNKLYQSPRGIGLICKKVGSDSLPRVSSRKDRVRASISAHVCQGIQCS